MSDQPSKLRTLESLRKALYPFARLLIYLGCSYKDFASVAKLAFLDGATAHLAGKGTITKSGLSEFSGVSKREITNLMQNSYGNVSLKHQRVPASEVLNEWSTNPSYAQPNGEPCFLPLRGGSRSISSLVHGIGVDNDAEEIVAELCDSGAIELAQNSEYRLVRRAQIYVGLSTASIYHFERTMYTVGSTLVSNMTSAPDDSKLLEQASYTYGLRPLALPKFLLLTRSSSESFIELVDEWISANEDNSEKLTGNFVTGVGVYAFHAPDNPARFDELEL